MRRTIPTVLAVAAAALAAAAPAHATSMTLDLSPDAGPYTRVADHTYFVPRWSYASLRGTTLDDSGAAGNSCIYTLRKPLQATAFERDGGLWCPNDFGDGTGRWSWSGVPNAENQQFKAVVEPDEYNGPAETNVVTLLTAPDLHWHVTYNGNQRVLDLQVTSDAEDYAGTLAVSQGGRVVATAPVSGNGTSERHVRTVPKRRRHRPVRCSGCLRRGAAFTVTLTPSDTARWVTMSASGRVVHDHLGDGEPVL
jgi:hypothetical protein